MCSGEGTLTEEIGEREDYECGCGSGVRHSVGHQKGCHMEEERTKNGGLIVMKAVSI